MERSLLNVPPLRIALLGDGRWAASSLTRLHDDGHNVVLVVVRRRPSDGTLAAAAAAAGAPVACPPGDEPALAATLAEAAPDLLVSIAYDRILRAASLQVPRLAAVNFHAGRLPQYRGRNVINWAIINGDRELGLTAHLMDEGIDSGPIVRQTTLPIGWTDTYGDVLERVIAAMPDFVGETVASLADATAIPVTQDHDRATYFGGRAAGDEWIDWAEPSERIHNKIRAISRPGPGARTWLDGEQVVIWRGHFDPQWPRYLATPGQVVGRTAGGVLVKTGDSTLLVTEAERPEGAAGTPDWPIGARLGINLAALVADLTERLDALTHTARSPVWE